MNGIFSSFSTLCVFEDLPFSRYGSLPLTDHGDDPVSAHIQGDVPEQRVAGCCRSKGHTFLDCRSAKESKSKKGHECGERKLFQINCQRYQGVTNSYVSAVTPPCGFKQYHIAIVFGVDVF